MQRTVSPILLFLFSLTNLSSATPDYAVFAETGAYKMIYDRRAGPVAIEGSDGRVFIAYQGAAMPANPRRVWARSMVTTWDPDSRSFSAPFALGPYSTDHHDGPFIWPDDKGRLQILSGCHRSTGSHLVTLKPEDLGTSLEDWTHGDGFPFYISYPHFFILPENRTLLFYRTYGHTSSWTYRITDSNGILWDGPEHDLTDLDSQGRLDWSGYHTAKVSPDGQTLHVVFVDYDDNKAKDPDRFFNPRYQLPFDNGAQKYNLFHIQVDLNTGAVTNSRGDLLQTPIHIDQAMEECLIWDTELRFTGIPPDINFDREGNPTILHVLSGDTPDLLDYYFLRWEDGTWVHSKIRSAGHSWNVGRIVQSPEGIWTAFLIVTEPGQLGDGIMDRHGGGRIEEWISSDGGATWEFERDRTPDPKKYPGWRFNNIRPVIRMDGSEAPGLAICYGWPDSTTPDARGFLMFTD